VKSGPTLSQVLRQGGSLSANASWVRHITSARLSVVATPTAYNAKRLDTRAGTVPLDVPKTAGTHVPFHANQLASTNNRLR
jgi:hypothetical protein